MIDYTEPKQCPYNSKTISGVFPKDNNIECRGFLESYVATDNRDKAHLICKLSHKIR